MSSTDINLKIRHAKRSNEKYLDISGYGMVDIPADIKSLSTLEVLVVSNNKLTTLKKVLDLPFLRVLDASNNNISQIPPEI